MTSFSFALCQSLCYIESGEFDRISDKQVINPWEFKPALEARIIKEIYNNIIYFGLVTCLSQM